MESPRSGTVAIGEEFAACGCAIDDAPLRSLLSAFDAPRTGWSSPTSAVVAGGATATLTASGADRFDQLRAEADVLFEQLRMPESLPSGARPRLFGGFSFTTGSDREATPDSPWQGYPDGQLVLPSVQVSVTSDGTWLTTTETGPDATEQARNRLHRWRDRIAALPVFEQGTPPAVTSMRRTPGVSAWRQGVESVVESIRRGDLQKVVLAQSLSAQLGSELNAVDILARLGEVYPGCYRFLLDPGGPTFFGVTPERLVRVRGRTVDTEALAGSIGRGETTDEDDWLAQHLRDSEKNVHEHELVVETIRQQLDGVTDNVETGERTVRKLANVQHLKTPIRGTLDGDRHVLELVERLHPTPAVGGLPPEDATRTIREHEEFDRGWYAAPVGWVDEHGDGTFVVGIRSAVADGSTVTLFAGAGIVSDSNPDEEWDELQLKFRPILDALT